VTLILDPVSFVAPGSFIYRIRVFRRDSLTRQLTLVLSAFASDLSLWASSGVRKNPHISVRTCGVRSVSNCLRWRVRMVFMGGVINCLKDTKWSRMLSGVLSDGRLHNLFEEVVTAAYFPFLMVSSHFRKRSRYCPRMGCCMVRPSWYGSWM